MQSVLPRIWTRVTVFISLDDNHNTTSTKRNEDMLNITQSSNTAS